MANGRDAAKVTVAAFEAWKATNVQWSLHAGVWQPQEDQI